MSYNKQTNLIHNLNWSVKSPDTQLEIYCVQVNCKQP